MPASGARERYDEPDDLVRRDDRGPSRRRCRSVPSTVVGLEARRSASGGSTMARRVRPVDSARHSIRFQSVRRLTATLRASNPVHRIRPRSCSGVESELQTGGAASRSPRVAATSAVRRPCDGCPVACRSGVAGVRDAVRCGPLCRAAGRASRCVEWARSAWGLAACMTRRRSIVLSTIRISSSANAAPRHRRTPPPNGIQP